MPSCMFLLGSFRSFNPANAMYILFFCRLWRTVCHKLRAATITLLCSETPQAYPLKEKWINPVRIKGGKIYTNEQFSPAELWIIWELHSSRGDLSTYELLRRAPDGMFYDVQMMERVISGLTRLAIVVCHRIHDDWYETWKLSDQVYRTHSPKMFP